MKRKYTHLMAWVLLGSLGLGLPLAVSEAGEPLEKIRQTTEAILAILNDPALQAPQRQEERRTRIRQTVTERFGFEEMARRALGIHWRKLTPAQQQEFVGLFSDLLERSYINKIESYGGSSQNIRYVKEAIDKDGYASVRTEIINERDLNAEVEYRLLQRNTSWEVYDVVIEGVSLVNNYRTQFNKIMHQESYEGLVAKLRLKLEQEEAATAAQ